jgi:hypothetical protein
MDLVMCTPRPAPDCRLRHQRVRRGSSVRSWLVLPTPDGPTSKILAPRRSASRSSAEMILIANPRQSRQGCALCGARIQEAMDSRSKGADELAGNDPKLYLVFALDILRLLVRWQRAGRFLFIEWRLPVAPGRAVTDAIIDAHFWERMTDVDCSGRRAAYGAEFSGCSALGER